MAVSPQVTSVLDDFNRADGLLNAGAGSALWTAGKIGATTGGNWNVASNAAKPNVAGAGHLAAFGVPADMEIVFSVPTGSATGYVAVYFCLSNPTAAGWEGYWFIYDTVNWKVRKRVAGVTTDVALIAVIASGHTLGTGDKVWIHHVGSAIKIRHFRASDGAWTDTPILDAVDATFSVSSQVAVEASGAWVIDNLLGGSAISESGPPGTLTLTVDADHPSATDSQTRSAVSASHPLKTIQKACQLAQASPSYADVIQVKKAATANPADPKGDASVYAAINHNRGGIVLPFGNNTGNQAIIMRGISGSRAAGGQAKWLGFLATSLKNWRFENLQFGYDFGSGLDVLTAQEWQTCNDLVFKDCFWTGGGAQIINAGVVGAAAGVMRWETCRISAHWSEFKATGGRRLDGTGFRIINSSVAGEDYRVHYEWVGCEIDHCQGEDAFQIGTGAATQLDTYCLWEDCWFHDVVQPGDDGTLENPARVHTDCVQILGGPEYRFRRCRWERCTSTIQASDYHNGLIWVEDCLFPRSAITDPAHAGYGFNAQGTDRIVLLHNTSVDNGFALAVRLAFKQPGVVTDITMINNIFDGVTYAGVIPGTVIDKGNIVGKTFGTYHISAQSRIGVAEFGTSPDTDMELASVPGFPNIARGTGAVDALVPATDRLGRARNTAAPSVGCHETPVAYTVTAQPRPPMLVSRSPDPGALGVTVSAAQVVLYPKPGVPINPATVVKANFYVSDPEGRRLDAASVVAGLANAAGNVLVTLTLAEQLLPLVVYSVAASGIADAEGSVILPTTWIFRAGGSTAGGGGGGDGGPATVEQVMSARWAVGATVSVYKAGTWAAGAPPTGPVIATGIVDGSSVVRFEGLEQGIRYVAYAAGIGVTFMVPQPIYKTVRIA